MKKVVVLGSTGSIGTQTLDVIRTHPDRFEVLGLVGYSNVPLLRRQAEEFRPKFLSALSPNAAAEKDFLPAKECLATLAEWGADVVVAATSGITALPVVLNCLKNGVDVALANKETLVVGGELFQESKQSFKGKLIPMDSEHSALWQCLHFGAEKQVEKLILTASGGALFSYSADEMKHVTPEKVLQHPNWSMGKKITVDSATMMNKGFEMIEAHWLFDVPYSKIEAVVHPQSIVHSLVEFADGSLLAQLAEPDMRIPIQLALTYPERLPLPLKKLDLTELGALTFCKIPEQKFPCFTLAKEMATKGGMAPVLLNAANDVAVQAFLQGALRFDEIAPFIRQIIYTYLSKFENKVTLDYILSADEEIRRRCAEQLKRGTSC